MRGRAGGKRLICNDFQTQAALKDPLIRPAARPTFSLEGRRNSGTALRNLRSINGARLAKFGSVDQGMTIGGSGILPPEPRVMYSALGICRSGHAVKKISRADAEALALAYWADKDLKGWRYDLGSLRRGHDSVWIAVFDTYSPSGNLVDGPVIVLIDADGARPGPDAL